MENTWTYENINCRIKLLANERELLITTTSNDQNLLGPHIGLSIKLDHSTLDSFIDFIVTNYCESKKG